LTGRELRNIRRLRLGLTQRELAAKLGMARNTITRYERGFLPTIPKYVELAVRGLAAADARERPSKGKRPG
jgi:transcriptional regulator with XRE-family HTH domain